MAGNALGNYAGMGQQLLGGMPKFGQSSAGFGGGSSMPSMFGQSFNPQQLMGGVGSLLGGLFGDSGAPYEAAQGQLQDYMNQARQIQNPFYQAGTAALPQYQQSVGQMSDPQEFLKKIMGGYQQTPWAQFQQNQGANTLQNQASASGLTGSTPFMQAGQQYAHDISSQDMQQYLQNILGINQGYQGGLQSLIQGGQGSANALTQLLASFAGPSSEAAAGQAAGGQNDLFSSLGGLASIGMAFL